MATKAHIYYCWSIDTTQTLTLNAFKSDCNSKGNHSESENEIVDGADKNVRFLSCLLKLGIFCKTLPCSNWWWTILKIAIILNFFIGSGRHAAFRKYVNGDNRLTQLFFTRMGNLVKMGKSAGGGWLPFWKVLAGKVLSLFIVFSITFAPALPVGSINCARYLANFAFRRPRWYSVAETWNSSFINQIT